MENSIEKRLKQSYEAGGGGEQCKSHIALPSWDMEAFTKKTSLSVEPCIKHWRKGDISQRESQMCKGSKVQVTKL